MAGRHRAPEPRRWDGAGPRRACAALIGVSLTTGFFSVYDIGGPEDSAIAMPVVPIPNNFETPENVMPIDPSLLVPPVLPATEIAALPVPTPSPLRKDAPAPRSRPATTTPRPSPSDMPQARPRATEKDADPPVTRSTPSPALSPSPRPRVAPAPTQPQPQPQPQRVVPRPVQPTRPQAQTPQTPNPVRITSTPPKVNAISDRVKSLNLKPTAARATQDILTATGFKGTLYGLANRTNPYSDHPKGYAVDFMTRDKATGDKIVAYAKANAARLGVKYTLWQVIDHYDHVHISFVG